MSKEIPKDTGGALSLRDAPAEVVRIVEEACAELERKGFHLTPEELVAIRQRQVAVGIMLGDPPITTAEAPERTVMVKTTDGKFNQQTFERDKTPGLSPLDSAVRMMRSAAYAYNEEDYTACEILARQAFELVVGALREQNYMGTSIEPAQNDG